LIRPLVLMLIPLDAEALMKRVQERHGDLCFNGTHGHQGRTMLDEVGFFRQSDAALEHRSAALIVWNLVIVPVH
jgi:hypothetical protein